MEHNALTFMTSAPRIISGQRRTPMTTSRTGLQVQHSRSNNVRVLPCTCCAQASPEDHLGDQVKSLYAAWNRRDLDAAVSHYSSNVEIHDVIFPRAFRGKKAAENFLRSCDRAFPKSFKFVIDDCTDTTDGDCATKFHIESNGRTVPFTAGVGFYKGDSEGILREYIYVEQPVKPGRVALGALSAALPLINRIPANVRERFFSKE